MILQKLSEARSLIKGMELKKAGWNDYSKYHYFLPEQINQMVFEAEKVTGLIHLFNLEKKDGDTYGYLKIIELETGESETFTQLTGIPAMTAANASQQIGGAVTYTNRYMLMTAYDISDNSLDFDAKDNREDKVQPTAKPENLPEKAKFKIPEKAFTQLCDRLKVNSDPLDRGNLLAKTRRYYLPFTNEQENTIKQITDN
jgi:hypothetical protein